MGRMCSALLVLAGCGHGGGNAPTPMKQVIAPALDASVPLDAARPANHCDEAAPLSGSCARVDVPECDEWRGNAKSSAEFRSACENDPDLRYSNHPCSSTRVIGGCAISSSLGCDTTWFAEPADAKALQHACKLVGATWLTP